MRSTLAILMLATVDGVEIDSFMMWHRSAPSPTPDALT